MIFALPFLAALLDATSLIFSKFFLRRFGRLTYKEFNWLVFLGIVCVLVLVCILTIGFPDPQTVSKQLLPIAGLGALGALGNIFFTRGLEEERVSNLEPFILFNPLAAILITSLVYSGERSWEIYLAIVLAAIALYWSHLKGHKLTLTRGLIAVMVVWVIYGSEVIIIKHLLQFFPPIHLYLLRCLIIWIALTAISTPNFRLTNARHLPFAFLLGGLAVATVTALYTAIAHLGAASSLFVMAISPLAVYWFSGIVLKERWSKNNIWATVAILVLVLGISLWRILK